MRRMPRNCRQSRQGSCYIQNVIPPTKAGAKNSLQPTQRMGAWSSETAGAQNTPVPDLRCFPPRPPHAR